MSHTENDGLFRRRRLPHWDVDNAIYFVTACLHGSIPARGILDINQYRTSLEAQPKPADMNDAEWKTRCQKRVFARFDEWADMRSAVRWLENQEAAAIVRDTLYHFADVRYDLLAYVVMPSHFHWVFRPRAEWFDKNGTTVEKRSPRDQIMQSIKGFTARRCNELLGRSGTFWQSESWDHIVRDEDELERIVCYVENNPVKAGLASKPENWIWSSARDRGQRTIVPGEYMLKWVK